MFGYAARRRAWAAAVFLLFGVLLSAPASAQSSCGTSVTLRFGETIADVGRRCGFTVSDIMAANPLIPSQYFVFPGLTIQLPAPPPPPVDETIRYVVRPGDTLSSIARVHGITLADIYRFNPDVDARTLRVGDVLFLPGFVAPPPPPPPPPVNTVNYTVRPGDTLYSIARANNMTVDELYALNPGLDPRYLRVGDVVRVRSGVINPPPPPPPPAGETIALSPSSGRTGTIVELTVSGYPRNAELRLLAGTRRNRLSEIQVFSVNRRGRATLEVRIPSWAADSPRFYFATELLDGGRRVTSDAFRITSGNQANNVTVDGTLTREGVQCPAMRGDNGQLYTLAGNLGGYRAGDRVRVVGRPVQASICQQGTTIELQSITGLN